MTAVSRTNAADIRPISAEAPRHEAAAAAAIAGRLADALRTLDVFQRLALIRATIGGRVVFATSFGLEDQALAHAILSQGLDIPLVTLDTGRLHPETHRVWAETERRYGVRVAGIVPERDHLEALLAEQGADGMRASIAARHACCRVRKVLPLGRALEGAAAWITGIRADQSGDRAGLPFAAFAVEQDLIKINPLLDFTRPQVAEFVRAHAVPYNALHDRGFLSIGCAPCTRAVAPDEPERAGRWWWEQDAQKECGLHFSPDGTAIGRKSLAAV
jgi:phosphoadenosine phosphosulfate reductase